MIQVSGLKFRYPKGRLILDDVSMNLKPGTVYGLFGGNGEGKSTLIKVFMGLLHPQSGSFTLFGENLSPRNVNTLQDLFIVPEDFEINGPRISTYEKVNSKFYPKFSKAQFYTIIEEFNLSPEDRIPSLSFGQKKKVLIAFGIASNTKLLLMDEPTNGLDIPSKSQFRKIMASAVDEGKCIVIATHQVRDLHSLIDHMIILDRTKVIFNLSLSEVSKKLWFGRAPAKGDSAIFSEAAFGGKVILPRKEREESEVDIELLYNAVLSDPTTLNKALNTSQHETAV